MLFSPIQARKQEKEYEKKILSMIVLPKLIFWYTENM